MVALESRLKDLLPLTVEAFMHACLYDAADGYYTRGLNFADPAHPKGRDFTTAPELTPLYGHTLANWVKREWERMGAPARRSPGEGGFTLAEAGPGRGTLTRDVLDHLKATAPDCFKAAKPLLIETSPALVKVQRQTLAGYGATWAAELAPQPHPTILLANELLDAFPVRHFVGDIERTVTTREDGTLAFSHPDTEVTREDSPAQTAWLQRLKAHHALSALFIDYGYTAPPSSHAGADTLQALRGHERVSPLSKPGDTDLTAHVAFHVAMETLGPAFCALDDLAPFLIDHGLLDLALPAINQPETASAVHRLIHPNAMGTLFKVLEYRAN
jgi:SAM-dependent MidA family methyltransferase